MDRGGFLRGAASVVLMVLATLALFASVLAIYVENEIVDPDSFAERAVATLDDERMRDVIARTITAELIDRGSTDLVAARPAIETAVGFVIDSGPFEGIFRTAMVEGNRLLFDSDRQNVTFDIADAGTVVVSALRSLAPDIARKIPKNTEATLLELREAKFARSTLAFADTVSEIALIAPLLTLVLFALSIGVARDRRAAVTRCGASVGVGGVLAFIGLVVLMALTLDGIRGDDVTDDEQVRGAIDALLTAFLDDLLTTVLLVSLLGIVIAAAARTLGTPQPVGAAAARATKLIVTPERAWLRALHGVTLLGLGIVAVLDPELALRVLAVLVGAFVVYIGAAEVLSVLGTAPERSPTIARARRHPRAVLAAGGALAAGLVLLIVLVSVGGDEEVAIDRAAIRECNGAAQLCDLRVDQVAFAGTHNSMSAADEEGWFIPNQFRTISRQLDDGIRLLLIDPHYAREDDKGRVRTDFEAEGRDANRVAKQLSPEAVQALERLGGSLDLGDFEGGERDVWLCHTVCELGATKLTDALDDVKDFLDDNPGEVVAMFLESFVDEADIERAFGESDLLDRVVLLDRAKPLPTLRQLVRSGKQLIVFDERETDGSLPWMQDAFAYVQDTPLGAKKAEDFTCDLKRGEADHPILMINNWVDVFPPRIGPNRPIIDADFLRDRARRCARQRKQPITFVATDYYDQGGLIEVVDELNATRRPAPSRRPAGG